MASATDAVTIAAKSFEALRAQTRTLARWWLAELRATLPQRVWSRIDSAARPCLSLAALAGEHVRGRLRTAKGVAEFTWSTTECSPHSVAEWLATQELRRDDVTVAIELDADRFFRRDLVVPKAALRALPSILAQDIQHRTPFEPEEIWHGATQQSDKPANDVVALSHWIIRRGHATAEVARCGLRTVDVDALGITNSGSDVTPMIALRDQALDQLAWASRAVRLMGFSAIFATLVGIVTILVVEASTTARVERAISELREQAGAGLGGSRAARLSALKAGPGVLDVWEELSRVLPEHTFLSELRIADGEISITGFSADAAHLVRLVEQSRLFTAAHLTGAITPDLTERKDRFSLAFRVRGTQVHEPRGTAVARGDR
ncbi:PilN domain-containing protein [Bradyrhizobium sp. Tv2a-2]|uniref:PilN domain-containing protein n=1 Tax=Bradyrhizobium sp. Tv2a-2 TaxID=113395 RepID=UPI0003FD1341|nr:PilN domain-containing protein [Bradyrhizobium sp. Tv2a-2]